MDKPRDHRTEAKTTAAECLARKSVTGTTASKFNIPKPWLTCLVENKRIWKEQAVKGEFTALRQIQSKEFELKRYS